MCSITYSADFPEPTSSYERLGIEPQGSAAANYALMRRCRGVLGTEVFGWLRRLKRLLQRQGLLKRPEAHGLGLLSDGWRIGLTVQWRALLPDPVLSQLGRVSLMAS